MRYIRVNTRDISKYNLARSLQLLIRKQPVVGINAATGTYPLETTMGPSLPSLLGKFTHTV